MSVSCGFRHPLVSRRTAIQAGAIGLLGLGTNHLHGLRALAGPAAGKTPLGQTPTGKAKSCIYIFLSGGLSQHESFDPKPDAPAEVRGEFQSIETNTPGLAISERPLFRYIAPATTPVFVASLPVDRWCCMPARGSPHACGFQPLRQD